MAKTKTRKTHPDFDAAPPTMRWTGPLKDLWEILELKAVREPRKWQGYVLPGGAWVAMRIVSGGQRQVRFARRPWNGDIIMSPTDVRWKRELETFRKYFGIEDWIEVGCGVRNKGVWRVYRDPASKSLEPDEDLDGTLEEGEEG